MRAGLVLVLGLCLCGTVDAAVVTPTGTCPAATDFEAAGYTIRNARIASPFDFLRFVRAQIQAAEHDVIQLKGQPYRTADVLRVAEALEDLYFLPDAGDQRVRVTVMVVAVENCDDRRLDLVYSVFSSQIAPVLSGTFESRRIEKSAPERTTGVDEATGRVRLSPSVGYDQSERFFGGGRLEYRPGAGLSLFPVDSISIQGRGSTSMHEFSAALAGSTETAADWLAHADWQLDYLNASEPTDHSRLGTHRLAAQLAAITRPLGAWQLPVRFGGLLEGGRLESDFRGAALPPDSVGSADYVATKLYLGTTTRLDRNVLAASYGLQVGMPEPDAAVGWLKHVGDVAHDVSIPIGDHRALSIESRLTAGLLQIPGTVPVSARFFGGNREEPFIAGDAWTIRSNPVIRSIPANRFDRTDDGPGGTRFFAYNLTAAFPIWRRPVVPSELSGNAEFRDMLRAQLDTATSFVQVDYQTKDPHYQRVTARLPEAREALGLLQTAVDAARPRAPERLEDLFAACATALRKAQRRAKAAAESKDGPQLGRVADLLSEDPDVDSLRSVLAACGKDLNAGLRDPQIRAAAARLEGIVADMQREFALIDQAKATDKAVVEMAYVKRTLNTVIDELNIVSISPVLMFDVAHLGPADARLGTRFGIGGGLRVTLVNSVDFTVGYVANPKRLADEPSGAFFFSLQFKDVFQ